MTAESLISAILPSLCVSILMVYFNRGKSKQAERARKREEQRKQNDKVQLELLLASTKLSYATAMAMKRGHANGEVEEGIEQYEQAISAFKSFERNLIVEDRI